MFQLSLHYLNYAGEEFRNLITGFHDAESCDAIREVLVNAFVMIHDSRIIEAVCIPPKAVL